MYRPANTLKRFLLLLATTSLLSRCGYGQQSSMSNAYVAQEPTETGNNDPDSGIADKQVVRNNSYRPPSFARSRQDSIRRTSIPNKSVLLLPSASLQSSSAASSHLSMPVETMATTADESEEEPRVANPLDILGSLLQEEEYNEHAVGYRSYNFEQDAQEWEMLKKMAGWLEKLYQDVEDNFAIGRLRGLTTRVAKAHAAFVHRHPWNFRHNRINKLIILKDAVTKEIKALQR